MTRIEMGYDGLILNLRAQGFDVVSPKDLKPVWIGHSGYVGCELQKAQWPFEKERIWIADPQMPRSAMVVSSTAEWLTLKLLDGHRPIPDLIHEFVNSGLECVEVQVGYHFSMQDLSAVFGPPIARATLLAKVADRMGFVIDPLAQTMELPEDHPLRSQR